MRHGVRLGVDPGDARVGVARSDPSGFLATPVETVRRGQGDLARIARLVTEEEVVEVVRDTVIHEVAHHFGIDDDRLHKIGAY